MSTPTRRRSTRLASSSSPSTPLESLPDVKKRKAKDGEAPAAKKSKQEPKQQSLEESIKSGNDEHANKGEQKEEVGDEAIKDREMEQARDIATENAKKEEDKTDDKAETKPNGDNKVEEPKTDNGDAVNEETKDKDTTTEATAAKPASRAAPPTTNDDGKGAVEESSQREKQVPSNILEKGIFYFFARGRVGLDTAQPSNTTEIARSYIVLRPLPAGASLSADVLPDSSTLRALALPKKVLPTSGTDRYMAIVDTAGATVQQLKDGVLAGSTYETQTAGTRAAPPATPLAEGVYAITSTGAGRAAHLAYMLAIPRAPGEVQRAVGLADRGSFVLSTRNPDASGPSYTQLDQPAKFSADIMERFAGRRWMPTEPAHLDHAHCQVLLIGEAQDALGAAAAQAPEGSADEAPPQDEMVLLQDEELKRVEALKGDDTIFDDLGISMDEFPQVLTTW